MLVTKKKVVFFTISNFRTRFYMVVAPRKKQDSHKEKEDYKMETSFNEIYVGAAI